MVNSYSVTSPFAISDTCVTMQHVSLSITLMQIATVHALQSRNVISFYLSSFYVEYIGFFLFVQHMHSCIKQLRITIFNME